MRHKPLRVGRKFRPSAPLPQSLWQEGPTTGMWLSQAQEQFLRELPTLVGTLSQKMRLLLRNRIRENQVPPDPLWDHQVVSQGRGSHQLRTKTVPSQPPAKASGRRSLPAVGGEEACGNANTLSVLENLPKLSFDKFAVAHRLLQQVSGSRSKWSLTPAKGRALRTLIHYLRHQPPQALVPLWSKTANVLWRRGRSLREPRRYLSPIMASLARHHVEMSTPPRTLVPGFWLPSP
jgi:hypothetical protein